MIVSRGVARTSKGRVSSPKFWTAIIKTLSTNWHESVKPIIFIRVFKSRTLQLHF